MRTSIHLCLLILTLSLFNFVHAQMVNPVHWNFSVKKTSNCEAELILKANIDNSWHLYGQKIIEDGPIPTSFKFVSGSNYSLVGKTTEGLSKKAFEPMFGAEINYFEKEAVFKQKIKIKGNKKFEITGELEFVSCNEVTCTMPTIVPFTFNVEGSADCKNNSEGKNQPIQIGQPDSITSAKTSAHGDSIKTTVTDTAKNVSLPQKKEDNGNNEPSSRSWWGIFVLGFLGGLAALLTPCVFPMIPMTVSFFTKQSKTRSKGISNALTYSASIIIIYVSLGLGVTYIFGSDALNALSTNVWFNLAFFVLLVVFAISFFGGFEIVLPSAFVNKIDAKGDKGGLIGIFFMAFALSLVSFSCTGPIIGTLLVDAAVNGGIKGPFWGMLGFSTALALPFGLFAAFPGWLNSLPKSGGWLNSVKVTLGFLELALALKFASNADLVVQAGILTREVFIALWIVIFGAMGMYLFGKLKFAHDSDMKFLPVPRLLLGILTLAFTFYLIPGLFGAPLKIISGFPPPDFYSESSGLSNFQKNISPADTSGKNTNDKKEHCPNNLPCFHDYDEALAYSKQVGKPLLIDFTGWACVNCRKMESQIWTNPSVDKKLRNDVVLVSLYVDDKSDLPENQQSVKKLGNTDYRIKTVGNKWSYMQAARYNTNTQPQYILVDEKEQMLTKETSHYDSDAGKYINWLDEGINEYKKRKSK